MSSPPPVSNPDATTPTRRRRWKRSLLRIAGMVLAAFLLMNLLMYNHAHSATHYAAAGEAPAKPEAMTTWEKARIAFTGVPIPRPRNHGTPESVGLLFTTHAIALQNDETLSVWLVEHPSPRGMVVLGHGYGACKSDLLPEAAAFHKLGWRCVLVDFRGGGDSSGNTTTIGVTEGADFAEAARWAKSRSPNRPLALFGFSMGSAAALKAVTAHGLEPDGIILAAPFDQMLNAVRGRFRTMGAPSWPNAELMLFWGGLQLGFDGFAHNPEEDAAAVTCPALVLHGTEDPRAPTEMADRVFGRLNGTKFLIPFHGAGHESFLRRDPAVWEAVVGGFLNQVEMEKNSPK